MLGTIWTAEPAVEDYDAAIAILEKGYEQTGSVIYSMPIGRIMMKIELEFYKDKL